MLDLQKLQQEVREWSTYNFGDQSPENPLMGVVEEVGELAHAVLKMRQQIRLAKPGAIEDAIGDIVIYYMDYLARIGFKIPSSDLNGFYSEAAYPITLLYIADAVGNICHSYIHTSGANRKPSYWAAGHVLTCLATFSKQRGINFEKAVTETWQIVKQRDWRKFPENGVSK